MSSLYNGCTNNAFNIVCGELERKKLLRNIKKVKLFINDDDSKRMAGCALQYTDFHFRLHPR